VSSFSERSVARRRASLQKAAPPSVVADLPVRYFGRRLPFGNAPLVMHLHGGWFFEGSIEEHSTAVDLLVSAGAIVASVEYPLAPLHPFPKSLEAIFLAASWLSEHRERIAGKGAPFWLAGEDAGGNLASGLSLMAADRRALDVSGQILFSPMLDCALGTQSARASNLGMAGDRFADGWRNYLARPADASHPYATPCAAFRLNRFPSTLLVTAADDPMRDEGKQFVARLQAADVRAELLEVPIPTGWPATYRSGAGAENPTPWPPASDLIRRFLKPQ
jgi:acetyl esterase